MDNIHYNMLVRRYNFLFCDSVSHQKCDMVNQIFFLSSTFLTNHLLVKWLPFLIINQARESSLGNKQVEGDCGYFLQNDLIQVELVK